MARFKGVGPVYIRKLAESMNIDIESKLSDEDRKWLHSLESFWVPIESWAHILNAMAVLGYGRTEIGLDKIGRGLADSNLKGIYRILARWAEIGFLAKQSALFWKQYHDRGEALTEMEDGDTKATFCVKGYPEMPQAVRIFNTGYVAGLMEFAKAKNVNVKLDESDPNVWKWHIKWTK